MRIQTDDPETEGLPRVPSSRARPALSQTQAATEAPSQLPAEQRITTDPLRLWASENLPASHPVRLLVDELPPKAELADLLSRVAEWTRLLRALAGAGHKRIH